jgi:hypothetical protein
MRQQLQYYKDEIITDLYTFDGKEWMYTDSTPYVGPYHRYTTGEVYTEPNWDELLSQKLIPYQDITTMSYKYKKLKPSIRTKYQQFNQYIVALTYNDYISTKITRYFIKKENEQIITEISKDVYDDYNKTNIDPNLYSVIQLTWYIAGELTNTMVNGITKIGVAEKNAAELLSAEKRMPGISMKLKDLAELYSDTEFLTPFDINDPTRLQK